MFLEKLGIQFDSSRLLPYLENIKWDESNRCNLNRPTGHWLYDPYEIIDSWRGTEVETLLNNIPYKIGEARLMKLDPGQCYRAHADIDDRYHLNLISNNECYLIDLTGQKLYPITSDNEIYKMDGSCIHTAVNFGSTPRVQLVIRIPLERSTLINPIMILLKFNDPPINLRYLLDHEFSPWVNLAIKKCEIGYFDYVSKTEFKFLIEKESLQEMQNILNCINLDYVIEQINT